MHYLLLQRSFEVTRGHQPSFANNFWSKRDRDVGLVSVRSSWPGESSDMQYDPFRSSRDLGLTWPEVKLWPWPFKVILYMVRRALTRQTQWYQIRCSIFKIKDFVVEKPFWKILEFSALENPILTWAKKWPKWFRNDFSRAFERCLSFFSTATRSRDHGGGAFKRPPPSRRWKIQRPSRARVKSGDCSLINNYRPISILPIMSKILEKLIHHRLITHVNQHDIIHENQFGFQKNKSTFMPILLLQESLTKAFEDGDYALGLYLDIKKAFDTVNIELLLTKLHKYGVRNKAHKILTSYLTGRFQCVKIRNSHSNFKEVTMGVPQGSILGPLLFIIYKNDLPKVSNKFTCLSYADDTAIIFKGKNSKVLQLTVNIAIEQITEWFHANFLSLNVSKTYTQHYTTRTTEFNKG